VAPRWAVEGAPLAVPAPQLPARANRRVSSLMMMRYRPTRMSLCRSGCGNFLALGRRCSMRRPRLTRTPWTRGSWRRPRRRGLQRRGPRRRPWRRQRLPRRLLAQLWMRPQELSGAHRPPARRPERLGPRGLWLQVAPPRQPNIPIGVFGNLSLSSFLSPLFSFFCVASFSYYLFAQVLSLRSGHRDGHGYRRCGCRGDSGTGSCQRALNPRRSP
jgi:hypothetical protein